MRKTVEAKAFVPAGDFALAKQFYKVILALRLSYRQWRTFISRSLMSALCGCGHSGRDPSVENQFAPV